MTREWLRFHIIDMAVLAEQVDDEVVDIPSANEESPRNCDSDASVASASQSSESRSDSIQSFLTKLRTLRRSDLTQKRKIRQNSAEISRKRKPSCSTDKKVCDPIAVGSRIPKRDADCFCRQAVLYCLQR